MTQPTEAAPSRLQMLVAFACIYVIWGSTYLAIRFAIETLPPFMMAGVRFVVAGGVLYAWARLPGRAAAPTREQWRAAAVVGLLLLLGGNGLLVWSELRIPSGVAALLVGIVPCWMVLIDWLRPGGARPTAQVVLGLLLGLAGLVGLIGPDALLGGRRPDLLGSAAVLIGSLCWALGSIYSRHASSPRSPILATAIQMLAGGCGLLVVGIAVGEPWRFDPGGFSLKSIFGFLYLIVLGSIVAFTAYIWLLRASTPARVSTYAYVNPVVAVLLGWALADEALTARMLIASVVIVAGVALITLTPRPEAAKPSG